jgi:hypothetical protein
MINVINIMMWGSRSEVYRFSGDNSEIKRTNISFPFDELWAKGLNIITNWNSIEKSIQEYQSKRIF